MTAAHDIELRLREIAQEFLREKKVTLFLGYEKAGLRLSTYVPERVQFGRDEVRMALRREGWLASRSGAAARSEPGMGRRPNDGSERTEL